MVLLRLPGVTEGLPVYLMAYTGICSEKLGIAPLPEFVIETYTSIIIGAKMVFSWLTGSFMPFTLCAPLGGGGSFQVRGWFHPCPSCVVRWGAAPP